MNFSYLTFLGFAGPKMYVTKYFILLPYLLVFSLVFEFTLMVLSIESLAEMKMKLIQELG